MLDYVVVRVSQGSGVLLAPGLAIAACVALLFGLI